MRFTKELILATEVMRRAPDEPISSRKLAEKLGTTEFFLQRIVGKLRKANLVKVKKGPEGGVFRNTAVTYCSVLDVYKAMGQEETEVEAGSFFDTVHKDILNFMGTMMVPLGLETEDATEGEGI